MAIIFVTPDILINQLKRDSQQIAESFDTLCDDDVKEMSELLAQSLGIVFAGLHHEVCENSELRRWSAEVLINVANTLSAAAYVLRAGYRLVPGVILRNSVEAMAVCLHGLYKPQDFPRIRAGKLESTRAIGTSKKVIPHFGQWYGFLSQYFVHIGPLHHSIQPLTRYDARGEDLITNLRAIRICIWFHYVVTEFAFVDIVPKTRYWRRITSGACVFSPSDSEREWQVRFLQGPEPMQGAEGI